MSIYNDDLERHCSFFQYLNNEEQDLVRNHSNQVHYRKNDHIFIQKTLTSHVMYLISGMVKTYREGRMGKRIILSIETPQNFLGLLSVFGGDVHEFSCSAIEATDVLFIDINIFKQIVHTNGKFALFLMNHLSRQGLHLLDRLMGQTHKQLPGRVADVLLYFSEIIYKSQRFTFPLTRRELAELAGTTKESFIRTLTEFRNDKIIEIDGSEVEIKSMKIIKTLSELG
ncbi:MAG: Crp/Fnr family transcriptional regulator [Bacteroidales bacterium]|nr:Crp/Fnr family transcriptional regulator [Bacteroidales bacterium]HPO64569.1 Crp/Fnr family transcriptional regulator [Bacteroidales bacterium]